MIPGMVSVSGADGVRGYSILRLLFAPINQVVGTLLLLPAVTFRHLYFSCPNVLSYNTHRCKICCAGCYHLYLFLFILMQLGLMALTVFLKFAFVCMSEASLDHAKH